MKLLIKRFKIFGCLIRIKILYLLLKYDSGLFVCEIRKILGEKQYNISKHLNILKANMFVNEIKIGRSVLYKIHKTKENQPFFNFILELEKLYKNEIFDFDFEQINQEIKTKENIILRKGYEEKN